TPDGKGKLRDVKGIKGASQSPSVPQQLADWAKRNGCTLTLQQKTVTREVTVLSYPCPKGHEVELYRVTGGGHTWPGSALSERALGIGGRREGHRQDEHEHQRHRVDLGVLPAALTLT